MTAFRFHIYSALKTFALRRCRESFERPQISGIEWFSSILLGVDVLVGQVDYQSFLSFIYSPAAPVWISHSEVQIIQGGVGEAQGGQRESCWFWDAQYQAWSTCSLYNTHNCYFHVQVHCRVSMDCDYVQ